MVRYSVIVPTRNRASNLRDALRQLTNQRDAPPHELIVVDNGSTDDTSAVVHTVPGVRYVYDPHGGCASAKNVGIEHATGDVLVFTDDDAAIPETWLAAYAEAYAMYPDAWAVGGPVKLLPESIPAWYHGTDLPLKLLFGPQMEHEEYETVTPLQPPHYLSGGNMSFSRTTLERVGRFREDLGYQPRNSSVYSEDWEFCRRVYSAGGTCYYCPKAFILHPVRSDRRTLRGTRRALFLYGRAGALSASLAPCSPVVAAKDAIKSLIRYARGDFAGGLRHELSARRAAGYLYQQLLGPTRAQFRQ